MLRFAVSILCILMALGLLCHNVRPSFIEGIYSLEVLMYSEIISLRAFRLILPVVLVQSSWLSGIVD